MTVVTYIHTTQTPFTALRRRCLSLSLSGISIPLRKDKPVNINSSGEFFGDTNRPLQPISVVLSVICSILTVSPCPLGIHITTIRTIVAETIHRRRCLHLINNNNIHTNHLLVRRTTTTIPTTRITTIPKKRVRSEAPCRRIIITILSPLLLLPVLLLRVRRHRPFDGRRGTPVTSLLEEVTAAAAAGEEDLRTFAVRAWDRRLAVACHRRR